MYFDDARKWIKKLNRQGYADYHDWRLPTFEEGASLIESSEMNGNLYVDPIFSSTQSWIWTGDHYDSSSAWVIDFCGGSVVHGVRGELRLLGHVRAVRFMQ